MQKHKLNLSSDRAFYSIQGEGSSAGRPSVFFRLAGCHLACQFCDTTAVWKQSSPYTYDEVLEYFSEHKLIEPLSKGASLIITGGAPLLQQDDLEAFLSRALDRLGYYWTVECETEGTIMPDTLLPWVSQWNVSPKLSNSGVDARKRYRRDVLMEHNKLNSFFKFPVTLDNIEAELGEIAFIAADCAIPSHKIWLMPVASTREQHIKIGGKIADIAASRNYNFSPRLQLLLWDVATGK